jgi:hypothetical protein
MSNEHDSNAGGIHIENVGGNVVLRVHGDLVGRDKTTSAVTQRTIVTQDQKEQFQKQIDGVRDSLREVKNQLSADQTLTLEEREQVETEILKQLGSFKDMKESAAQFPVNQPAPPQALTNVRNTLEQADGLVEKFQRLAEKSVGLAEKVGGFVAKLGPLVAMARHFFGPA